ncbi:MAG: D-2-hydroxyacid dehydrogenase [Chloroflexia bacterium]|nr:D-2-hydroxyacid dehydrogenase [Chloroflexia bacterium]
MTRIVVGVSLSPAYRDRLHEAHPSLTFDYRAEEGGRSDLGHADAFIGWQISDEQVRGAGRLRWVQLMSAGVEHLPVAALEASDVVVTNASGAHAINIGEHVMAMMLAFARQLPFLVREQDQRRWFDGSMRERVFELHGQTLVILGTGQIATALAARAAGFGMRVVGVRRHDDRPVPSGFDEVVTLDHLDEYLPVADHLAVCVPLTASTRHLIDARRLGLLKPGAHFFNIGRGAVIDQDAMIEALRSGHLAGAGLDVTDPEPLPADSPLWTMPNVLITSHSSGASPHYLDRAVGIASDNIARWQAGEPLRNVVDLDEGY